MSCYLDGLSLRAIDKVLAMPPESRRPRAKALTALMRYRLQDYRQFGCLWPALEQSLERDLERLTVAAATTPAAGV